MFQRYVLTLILAAAASTNLAAQSSRIPTPESVLGFKPGADYKLATYEQSIDVLQEARRGERSHDARRGGHARRRDARYYFALISSPENLAKIDRYREIAQRLAHPEGLTDAQARRLAREGKAFVHIDGGLHSTEIAGSQHTLQLAYDLLSARRRSRRSKAILDNVVLMLWPTINPDGQNIVANWYMENVGTPYELSRCRGSIRNTSATTTTATPTCST